MTRSALAILDPRPQRHLTATEGTGGVIKERAEDFLVDELPLYEPAGDGEHLYLFVEKANTSHGEMMSVLQRHFNVSEDAIGYAGMKDKIGVTRQLVSIHLLAPEPTTSLEHDRVRILWSARHRNKLRRGHLAGNRFVLRIRQVDPLNVRSATQTLRELERHGVPNYFGYQRFGYRLNNHLLATSLLAGDWQGVLDELLGATGTPFPERQRGGREAFDRGDYETAATLWTRSDRSERAAVNALRRGEGAQRAVTSIGRIGLHFWISALQSAVFNSVLDQRIDGGILGDLLEGDLAWKHGAPTDGGAVTPGRGAVFAVTAKELASGELRSRLDTLEISPSGPLWGRDMKRAEGITGEKERDALRAAGLSIDMFDTAVGGTPGVKSPIMLKGARRPLRIPIRNTEIDGGVDEHGNYIRLAFDLPRGSYATIVLREIMKCAEAESAPDSPTMLRDLEG